LRVPRFLGVSSLGSGVVTVRFVVVGVFGPFAMKPQHHYQLPGVTTWSFLGKHGTPLIMGLFGFQRGVMVVRRFQLGFPAYRSARIR